MKKLSGLLICLLLLVVMACASADGAMPTLEYPKGDIYVNEPSHWAVIAPDATIAYIKFKIGTETVTHYLWDCPSIDSDGTYHPGIPGYFTEHDGFYVDHPGQLTVSAAVSYTDEEWMVPNEDKFVWTDEVVMQFTVKSEGKLPKAKVDVPEKLKPGEGFTVKLPSDPGVKYRIMLRMPNYKYFSIPQYGSDPALPGGGSYELEGKLFDKEGEYKLLIYSEKPRWENSEASYTIQVGDKKKDEGKNEPGEKPKSDLIVDATGLYTVNNGEATLIDLLNYTGAKLTVPDKVSGYKVTAIGEKLCQDMTTLQTVSIGKNVKTIGKNAFSGCTNLKKISGGKGLEKIGDSAFQGCASLQSITLNSKVRSIGANAFNNCKKLKKIILKTKKLTKKTVGKNAFKGISKKVVIQCPKGMQKAYKSILKKKGVPKKAKYK